MVKTIVICIDRDNDIGEKLGVEGPIIGREKNLEIAKNLALEDPEESDANCLFGAIKEFDNLKKEKNSVEIVTLLGDKDIGIISDSKIEEQLEKVVKKLKPKKAVFVSDGAEDEYVLPIIQSKLDIISVRRVVVKQSSQLESSYYMITKFFKEIIHDPQTSRIIFGIPAIILVLYALFGDIGWRLILGVVGIYLLIKAFHLEDFVNTFINELSSTFSKDKVSFFFYILGGTFFVIGFVYSYNTYNLYLNSNFIISILTSLQGGLIYYFISGIFVLTGRLLYFMGKKAKNIRYVTYYALLFSSYIVLENSIKYVVMSEYNILYLIFSVIISFLILLIALIAEKVAYS
jgi:putative membrane protein